MPLLRQGLGLQGETGAKKGEEGEKKVIDNYYTL